MSNLKIHSEPFRYQKSTSKWTSHPLTPNQWPYFPISFLHEVVCVINGSPSCPLQELLLFLCPIKTSTLMRKPGLRNNLPEEPAWAPDRLDGHSQDLHLATCAQKGERSVTPRRAIVIWCSRPGASPANHRRLHSMTIKRGQITRVSMMHTEILSKVSLGSSKLQFLIPWWWHTWVVFKVGGMLWGPVRCQGG